MRLNIKADKAPFPISAPIPMASTVTTLIEDIAWNGHLLSRTNDDIAKQEILMAASSLILALESPGQTLARIGWGEPARNVAIRIALDLGLFTKLDKGDKCSAELAEESGADLELISRTMKHLAATGIVAEADKEIYRSTPFSSAMNEPSIRDGIIWSFEGMGPAFQGLPAYLAKTKYKAPTNQSDGPFQYGHRTSLPRFGLFQENARLGRAFHSFMSGFSLARGRWTEVYPVQERLRGEDLDERGTLLVDIGGGMGYDIAAFHLEYPDIPGRLVLQDLEPVISQVKDAPESLPSAIVPTVHNFFTSQPVIGARAYYLHFILHEWSDERSATILGHLRDAMKEGYSKILINEFVVPDVEASWQITGMDWKMMGLLAMRERTESQWRGLLARAGLKVTSIWNRDLGSESIIEAVKMEKE